MKTAAIPVLLLCMSVPLLWSQNSGTKNPTVEEIYLQRQQTVESFNRLAQASDIQTRVLVLNELEKMLQDGKLTSQDDDYISILDYLASDGVTMIARENNKKVHDYPEIRMLSCRLLAKVGGAQAEKVLTTVAINDNATSVVSEAVYGLGMIGNDKDGKASSLIAYLITKWDVLRPDDNLAFASLLAIEKIAEKNNGIYDPEVLRAVIRLSLPGGVYVKEVKQKALEVFAKLRSYM